VGSDDHGENAGSINPGKVVAQALVELERSGLLLFSDPALPSLVGLIVDEPLRKSWWGHPRGHLIFQAMNVLADDPRVMSTKLVAGKVTYVHRRLWQAIYALGCAREPWQMDALSEAARWLLQQVDADGELQSDLLGPRKAVPEAARELERRLLVHADEVHTASGAHAKVLQTWPRWAANQQLVVAGLAVVEARRQLESAAEQLSAGIAGGMASLPWQAPTRARRPRR
jgi:hypothetical protein